MVSRRTLERKIPEVYEQVLLGTFPVEDLQGEERSEKPKKTSY